MFSTLRTRFGIPGVISVIALVFAMLGGAYAASNSGDGKKATASAKAKKGPRGPKGATGPAGPQGPAGPAGANGQDGLNGLDGEDGDDGDDGDDGANGANGTDGADGTNGTSVANTSEPAGANCTEGGTKLVGTSTTYACNGLKGEDGEDGQTGFTETLPAGKTETGAWSFGPLKAGELPEPFPQNLSLSERIRVPISFPIPLSAALLGVNTHVLPKDAPATANCPGTSVDPQAAPGHLCVYTHDQSPPVNEETFEGVIYQAGTEITNPAAIGQGASKAGALIDFIIFGKKEVEKEGGGTEVVVTGAGAFAKGTWAVTAPLPTP